MFRTSTTIDSQFQFACKKYLANATIVADQTQVGVVTKPNTQGYVVFMLDYLDFGINQDIDNTDFSIILDYTLVQ